MQEELFLSSERVDFYQFYGDDAAQETRFLAKPKSAECMMFMEQMNGVLNLMHQHMKFQQYKREEFIPRVAEFKSETGELSLIIPADLSTAVPTLSIDYNNIIINQRNAAWITKQAFLLASLAYEVGIVLPISTENFLVCHNSEVFALLDWSMAQVVEKGRISADVAQKQVVDFATLLLSMVDYAGAVSNTPLSLTGRFLYKFMHDAADGAFATAAEAQQALNLILG